jgi:hypothetical protein
MSGRCDSEMLVVILEIKWFGRLFVSWTSCNALRWRQVLFLVSSRTVRDGDIEGGKSCYFRSSRPLIAILPPRYRDMLAQAALSGIWWRS